MQTNIVLLVEDKDKLLEQLRDGLIEAEQYASLCVDVLVTKYGANRETIDTEALIEGSWGHLVDCTMKNTSPMHPSDFIAKMLESYSDYGLKKCGLTRSLYNAAPNKHLHRTAQAGLLLE